MSSDAWEFCTQGQPRSGVNSFFFIPESGITDSLTLDIYLVIPKIDRHL